MLRRNEYRLNIKNRPVRTGDINGGPKQPPLATNRGSQEPATNRVKGLYLYISYILFNFFKGLHE